MIFFFKETLFGLVSSHYEKLSRFLERKKNHFFGLAKMRQGDE
jgi:uncharacterized protein YozE (UPF0346 family)